MPTFSEKPLPPNSAKQAARTIWIIFIALIIGQLFFCGVVIFILTKQDPQQQPPPKVKPELILVSGAMLAAIPIAYFIRRALVKKALQAPLPLLWQKYTSACIIFWAGCEGPGFFAIIVVMIHKNLLPTIIFFAIALACMIVGYPRTSALRPANETFKIE